MARPNVHIFSQSDIYFNNILFSVFVTESERAPCQ